jgi:hypothetical protein
MAERETKPEALVEQLYTAGRRAYSEGNRQKAHDFWRQAAAIQPHEERLWQALLTVVEDTRDRRVCLENIVAINPRNKDAARQLQTLDVLQGMPRTTASPGRVRRALTSALRMLLLGLILLGLLIAGFLAGIALNLY